MSQKRKKIKAEKVKTNKTVTSIEHSTNNQKVCWCFDRVDRDGYFAFDTDRADFCHKEIIEKLMEYGKLTWSEINAQTHDRNKSKHHFLKGNGFSKEAKNRVKVKLNEEESDQIFSFALQNKLRIIGLRDNEKFYVVWYDPNHEFFPINR